MAAQKRREPVAVPPVVIDGVRYEAPFSGAEAGIYQDGGVVAAYDEANGALVWALAIYPADPDPEDEDGDVFIATMTPGDDGKSLFIVSERGDEYRLDLASQTVTPVRIGDD